MCYLLRSMAHMRAANDDFDPAAARASLQLVRATVARYFRLEAHGAEHIPYGRCLVVGCHSGVVPYDAACTLVAIEAKTGRLARAVGDELFGRSKLVEAYLRQRGAIVGRRAEAAAIVRQGNILLVFPGGAADMTRPICPYPQGPKYLGTGSTNEARNFYCAAP